MSYAANGAIHPCESVSPSLVRPSLMSTSFVCAAPETRLHLLTCHLRLVSPPFRCETIFPLSSPSLMHTQSLPLTFFFCSFYIPPSLPSPRLSPRSFTSLTALGLLLHIGPVPVALLQSPASPKTSFRHLPAYNHSFTFSPHPRLVVSAPQHLSHFSCVQTKLHQHSLPHAQTKYSPSAAFDSHPDSPSACAAHTTAYSP